MYGSVIPARSHTSTVIAQYWLPGPGALAADEVSILRQQVHIPEGGPATAHGTIIDVTWSVRARVHGHDIQSSSRRYDLLVTSAAGARGAETELPAIAVDHGRAILEVLNLSSRAIRGGVALTGTLRLLAINDLASRGARVDLIMTEAVSSGPGGTGPADRRPDQDATDCETVVVSTQFPAQHLAAGDEVSLPFSLLAPNPLPAPSLDFDNLHVGWQLRGCLPLLLRQEPTITVQLAGVTAG
jgi:hypothetical protein